MYLKLVIFPLLHTFYGSRNKICYIPISCIYLTTFYLKTCIYICMHLHFCIAHCLCLSEIINRNFPLWAC